MHSHPWCKRLLTPLPDEVLRAAVAADDPLWETVETELVKLGSLAHSQVDLNAVAGHCLTLLESRTKDMRVLVQLLRCLQHPAKATPCATALMLLDSWLATYWALAWPASPVQKQKLMIQIIRRFESVMPRIAESASGAELAQLQHLAEQVANRWRDLSDKADLTDELVQGLKRARQRNQAQEQADQAAAPPSAGRRATTETPDVNGDSASDCAIEVNTADERGWRQTQLKVAAELVERQPEAPVGYRLRRHAIWSGIATPPLASRGNKTQLAPVSPDRVDEYHSALGQADLGLWERIEQSLTLAPYWFDGHMLSASVATRLGYAPVAGAIAEELSAFLNRLPALRELTFSDGSPFLTAKCSQWLNAAPVGREGGERQDDLATEAAACRSEQGMAAALSLLDERMRRLKEPRDRFYAELVLADLLAEDGMKALATQHYQHLWQESQQLNLMQWEPGMVGRLERLAASRKK
ncbi:MULTISPECIES: type VI secretion system protein TssA [unclassified Brenneria]|uniref:type VI secretion system protein TssA n=1 Tax=unclassified Brenneria TaxID=2634434 RepID=UPI001553390F|nr:MULTISPECIES: type VI secretion system protein TssA [unclassified Brenneria]MBJ7223756.1 type VI secretion system protein TssA [Brenneria sp. L3-3C-1]MEE3645000.1 type VI secretion system protein TssA [Brenneria sp. L3_3C_1]MEE3652921.1 type VI secretion system protein TssA [Brenneria sp. HEZEL_4_2_4]NPD02875.1 type VI secretion system protein TssA [Brenneria sp. hezel4-2-4]